MKQLIVLLLVTIFLSPGNTQCQDRDSMLNTDSMYYQMYTDTSDWIDFIADTTNNAMASQLKNCTDKTWKRRDPGFNLCNTNPYVLIFHDKFNTLDENMWFQRNGAGFDWDWWNSDNYSGLCLEPNSPGYYDGRNNMQGQQLYMRDNVRADNGYLKIDTKPVAWAVPWCGNGNSRFIYNAQDCTDNYRNVNYFYTSGRAQTTWAFSRGENFTGDGLIVEAKLKVPDKDGLWPAFWMNTIDGESDEFDIFEFMDNEWNKLKMTIHHRGADASIQCRETKNLYDNSSSLERRAFFDAFHTFTFFYTDYSLAVFLDGKLKWQKHHGGRHSALSHFDCDVSKNEYWGERVRYCDRPMRIVLNTHVYCSNNGNHPEPNNQVNATMEVDYIRVWRKLACLDFKKIEYPSQLNLKSCEYNVIAAKKVEVDMDHSGTSAYDITDGKYLKILANDYVELNEIAVDPANGTLEIETTMDDLCKDAFDFKGVGVNRRFSEITGGRQIHENLMPVKSAPNKDIQNIRIYQESNILHITSYIPNKYLRIQLYDIQGRMMKFNLQENNNGDLTFATDQISNGVYYLVMVNSRGETNTKRVYIENRKS
ncbi:MAG: family 16 glycosylhydrolase [Bacteroidetes bacterium]|nr:family 16 glycosylhydrolase [Bacteroidota bacterium]